MFKFLKSNDFHCLEKNILELNNIGELKKIFGWDKPPELSDPAIFEFEDIYDVNERRIRDAECLATVCQNKGEGTFLEIGTGTGHGTALMAMNAPKARIFTVNSPAGEIFSGRAGIYTTHALEQESIGEYYKSLNLNNIVQILANTANWEPGIGTIDVAFIDGCHDTEFVYNDTLKVLKHMAKGGFILWHDFNPHLTMKYEWIRNVCLALERLYSESRLAGKIYHIRDSWMGVYQIQ